MKNASEILGNKADQTEERISKRKDRNLEIIQVEEERELRGFFKKMKELYNYLPALTIHSARKSNQSNFSHVLKVIAFNILNEPSMANMTTCI